MRTSIQPDVLHDKVIRQQQLMRCKATFNNLSPSDEKELEALNKEIKIEMFLARGFQVLDGGKDDELKETG